MISAILAVFFVTAELVVVGYFSIKIPVFVRLLALFRSANGYTEYTYFI